VLSGFVEARFSVSGPFSLLVVLGLKVVSVA
jgi:hypothetical protein